MLVADEWDSHDSRRDELLLNGRPYFNRGKEWAGGGTNWGSQLGFFGRLNYNLLIDTYLSNLRAAEHQSSTDLQWRWFPSFSGWMVLSEERFMESLKPVLSLPLRPELPKCVGDRVAILMHFTCLQ